MPPQRASRPGAEPRCVPVVLDWRAGARDDRHLDHLRVAAHAARDAGARLVVTLCARHFPVDAGPDTGAFAQRLAALARDAACIVRPLAAHPPRYVPVSEIAFLAFAWSCTSLLRPRRLRDTSREVVTDILVRASIAARVAITEIDPRAQFRHVEALVDIDGEAGTCADLRSDLTRVLDPLVGAATPARDAHARGSDDIALVSYAGDGAAQPRVPVRDVCTLLAARYGLPVLHQCATPAPSWCAGAPRRAPLRAEPRAGHTHPHSRGGRHGAPALVDLSSYRSHRTPAWTP
jgi:hypothetical protein